MNKIFICLLFIALIPVYGYSQEELIKNQDLLKLNDHEKEVFKRVINGMVKDLQIYIKTISNKDENNQRRLDAIGMATQLFAKPDSNIVEVSSNKTGLVRSIQVESYFNRLYAIEAKQVEITFYDVARLDSLRRAPDGKYYGTAYVYQLTKIYFQDKKSADYIDKTIKKINIELEPQDYWLKNQRGPKYAAKLSDIKVVETI